MKKMILHHIEQRHLEHHQLFWEVKVTELAWFYPTKYFSTNLTICELCQFQHLEAHPAEHPAEEEAGGVRLLPEKASLVAL